MMDCWACGKQMDLEDQDTLWVCPCGNTQPVRVDDMPDDREEYYNRRAEEMP
jgi:predicted RNA-binding Zn-ribbon protein involved in translation (DUF1610 family)